MIGVVVLLLFSVLLFFAAVPTLFLEVGVGVVLLASSVLLLVAGIGRLVGQAGRDGDEPRTTGGTRTTGAGRAVLRTVRTVNDVRAMSRGPAAYGKRVARRAAFRSLRKW